MVSGAAIVGRNGGKLGSRLEAMTTTSETIEIS